MAHSLLSSALVLMTFGSACNGKDLGVLDWEEAGDFALLKPKTNKFKISVTTRPNVYQCAFECQKNNDCSSFFYVESDGRCLLMKTVFSMRGNLQQERKPFAYYRILDEGCPPEKSFYKLREGLCLGLFSSPTPMDYSHSQDLCRELGARLPILKTPAENKAALRFLVAALDAVSLHVFLGATKKVDNSWTWNDNTPVASLAASGDRDSGSFWTADQPDILNFRHDLCLSLSGVGLGAEWVERSCKRPTVDENGLSHVLCEFV